MTLKIAVHGQHGRLGSCIISCAKDRSFVDITPLKQSDVIIDVTSPAGTKKMLLFCVENNIPLVIGTTGHTNEELETIKQTATSIPILVSPNFSPGMLVIQHFLKLLFMQYGKGYVDIIEKHHEKKKDAPSGTALFLKQQILLLSPESIVEIHSIRHPGEIGEHRLIFSFDHEKIEISHCATSREAFAKGALIAASFLNKQSPGIYYLKDIYRHVESQKCNH
ncbi:MAG: hypothetical protein HY860_06160 [Chlamydiales bacterium]|nr:hypothetical protein [Chlamydiales bacterium]